MRELSKRPARFKAFCEANPGRVLFGTDIVANEHMDNSIGFDLFASRFWALRTVMETTYDGPSPIVDPDLHKIDPSVSKYATAHLRGAALEPDTLRDVYYNAAAKVFGLDAQAD